MRIQRGIPWRLMGVTWATVGGASLLYGIVMMIVSIVSGRRSFPAEAFLPFGIWIGISISVFILAVVVVFLLWLGEGWYLYFTRGKDLDS